jgi:hypothetical protein
VTGLPHAQAAYIARPRAVYNAASDRRAWAAEIVRAHGAGESGGDPGGNRKGEYWRLSFEPCQHGLIHGRYLYAQAACVRL